MASLINQIKKILKKSLITLGKPLFYLFTFLAIFFFFLLQLIKQLHQAALQQIKEKLSKLKKPELPSLPTISLPPLKLPKPKTIVIILTFSSLTFFLYTFFNSLPSPKKLKTKTPVLSTKIYDRNENLLYKMYKNENRTLVKLENLPPHLIQATLAAEDKNFYHHPGISFKGITRALKNNLFKNSLQGGSTITQQLIKNTLLSPEKTLARKIKEAILAIETELIYEKDQILEMYLNEVPYGGTAYGIEEAANLYFNKSAKNLTLEESAFLAGLPTAPTTLSPYGPQPYRSKKRQEQVLDNMIKANFITLSQAEKAKQKNLTLASKNISIKAPHFVMYVKDLLAQKYSEEILLQGGLEIHTTLDLELQNLLQENIQKELQNLEHLNVTNGAGMITNPQTGEILAMVGSRNFYDFPSDGQVNVTLRPRQPGSSIKPLTYALAFSQGYTPADKILDAPVSFPIPGHDPYKPTNYDGKFHGLITLRTALASSYNVPAVKLLNQLGTKNLISFTRKMGITNWNEPERYGLSLTLGGADVKMYDLAQTYSVFANQGIKKPLNPILKIKTPQGKTLPNPFKKEEERIIPASIAFQITDVLSDPQARAPAFGYNSILNLDKQTAVKTGTSNDLRDNWTIGYTQNRLTAIWVGNNNNQPMSQVASGITGASPIWAKTMKTLIQNSYQTFKQPENLKKVYICPETQTLYCNSCPSPGRWEYYVKGTQPNSACNEEMTGKILEEAATTKNSN